MRYRRQSVQKPCTKLQSRLIYMTTAQAAPPAVHAPWMYYWLPASSAALLLLCTTVQLYYCTTVLLVYSSDVLLLYLSSVLLLFYYSTILLLNYSTILLCFCATTVLPYNWLQYNSLYAH